MSGDEMIYIVNRILMVIFEKDENNVFTAKICFKIKFNLTVSFLIHNSLARYSLCL